MCSKRERECPIKGGAWQREMSSGGIWERRGLKEKRNTVYRKIESTYIYCIYGKIEKSKESQKEMNGHAGRG